MKKLGSLLLGLALSAGSQAAVLSYSFSSEQALTDFDLSGRLGLFDSQLGTLTGVSLELYGEVATTLSLTNTGKTQMRRAQVSSNIDMFFSSSLTALDGLLGQGEAPWLSWSVDTGLVTQLAPGATRTFEPATDGALATIDAGSLLSSFTRTGGGDFGLDCLTQTTTSGTSTGGNLRTSQTTLGSCSATITYTYTVPPAPAPVSGSLGGGLISSGGLLSSGGLTTSGSLVTSGNLSSGGSVVGSGSPISGSNSTGSSVPVPVPEPPSLAVLGLALAWMAARGRRGAKPRAGHGV